MLYGLLQTQSGTLLIFETADVEGEGSRLLLDLKEHGARRLHLELIGYRRIFLVDRRPGFL